MSELTAALATIEKCREVSGCPAGVDLQDWVKQLAAERDEALNAERIWGKTMMEVCGEDGPASVASEIRSLQALRDTAMQALKSQVGQLAAENVGLKAAAEFATAPDMWIEQADGMLDYRYCDWYVDVLKAAMETPATDRIVAGIKADGVEMFVEKCREESMRAIYSDIRNNWWLAGEHAEDFARQMRDGSDK
ncbi:hypothetical protein LUS60_06725 [Raoultella planticola]|nr:hypothetical protein [Raoultella planticola]MCD9604986.1 hypothetical protein [Raoultella planticola]